LTVTNDSCAVVLLLLVSTAKSRGQLGALVVRSKQEWVEVVVLRPSVSNSAPELR